MPSTISAEARAALATSAHRPKKVELIYELMNADLRVTVDVSRYVREYGTVGGDSTIRAKAWPKPKWNPSFQIDEETKYMLPNHATSVWASFEAEPVDPKRCWVRFTTYVVKANGSLEAVKTWIGKIVDYQVRLDDELWRLELVTEHPTAKPLSAKIDKNTGDELVLLGSNW